MPGRGPKPGGYPADADALSAEEFAARFQGGARVLWTIAAGVLGDSSEAEDVLQEAALMAWSKRDQFRSGTNFKAWMGRFVRNVALNHARKRRRRATHPTDPDQIRELDVHPDPTSPETLDGFEAPAPVNGRGELAEDQSAFDDRVLHGLQELRPTQRAALLLRTILGYAYHDIASVLEIPEGTAMSHVHRARQFLRHKLTEDGRDRILTDDRTEMERWA